MSKKIQKIQFFIFLAYWVIKYVQLAPFLQMSEEDKIKKEQAEGESGGEKEQAKSKIDKIEKILGAKIVYACPRYVRGQGNG